MIKREVYNLIEIEDLNEDLQMIATVCGIEPVRFLLREFASQHFYIPKITRFERFIKRYIKQHSDKTYNQIARQLGISQPYVKKVARSSYN